MSDLLVELLVRRPADLVDEPDRLPTLLELLDRPDRALPAIWVGGGNGKSSIITMLAALFAAVEITAGAATTPHLQDVRERLRVAGEAIATKTLRENLRYLEPFLREVDARFRTPLSFDEVLHAMAATWFADAPVGVALYEGDVDEGGRADVAVQLGDQPTATIRTGDGQTRIFGADFAVEDREIAVGGQLLTLRTPSQVVDEIYLPLHGTHQAANAAVALATFDAFLGFSGLLDARLIRQAFASIRLPGRLEVVRRTDAASVLLDGARNAAGAAALAEALHSEFAVRHRIGVLGLENATAPGVVQALRDALDHLVVVPAPTPSAASAHEVVAAAREAGLPVEMADTVPAALEFASGVATTEDAVVVTGGLQTVGAARRALGLAPADDLLDMQ